MSAKDEAGAPEAPKSPPSMQTAELDLSFRPPRLQARVQVTPPGLLAIGGLVSGILLSTAALVWVSTSVARRHPIASRIRPR